MVEKAPQGYLDFDFKHDDTAPVIPKGLRTKIRTIMQESYFVIPDKEGIKSGFPEIEKIKNMLENESWKIDQDYVIAKSLATVAYLVLREVI
ncbi:MAG: hypothetical protein WC900_00985 [Oscillospiraceae bacterium]